MDRATEQAVEALQNLGFNGLEAEVYAFLLKESPVTGYRIATGLGKPAANTYKAVESLAAKGAVLIVEGKNRLCRAVPPVELLASLERNFTGSKSRAQDALDLLGAPETDDRIYHLRSRDQVYERARAMLARCTEIAVIDAFPEPLAELHDEILRLSTGDVTVCVKAYREIELEQAHIHVDPRGDLVIERWPGQWLNIVVDGAEHMLAFMEPDGGAVHQAVWSGSAYISWVYHSALMSEWILADLQGRVEQGSSIESLQERSRGYRSLIPHHAPGYRKLMTRFGNGQQKSKTTTAKKP